MSLGRGMIDLAPLNWQTSTATFREMMYSNSPVVALVGGKLRSTLPGVVLRSPSCDGRITVDAKRDDKT